MSAALAHPVPAARREAPRPTRLRVVAAPAGPVRSTGRGRAAGRPARPAAVPPAGARGAGGAAGATATGPHSGFLLLPLGGVLVPAGGRPVLRVVSDGEAVRAARGRVAGGCVGAMGSTVPADRRRTGSAATRSPAACARGCRPGGRRRRVTPRARRAVVAVLAGFLVAGGVRGATGGGGASVAAAAVPAAQQVVVVEQGQTLWSLARALAPEQDPREVVQRLRSANRLESAGLAVGQRLVLPALG